MTTISKALDRAIADKSDVRKAKRYVNCVTSAVRAMPASQRTERYTSNTRNKLERVVVRCIKLIGKSS